MLTRILARREREKEKERERERKDEHFEATNLRSNDCCSDQSLCQWLMVHVMMDGKTKK